MIGQTVSHYKILERLGGGGMGVVHKAQDLKLDRPVALKFLAPDLTRDPEAKQRFVHEAKAASALQHNNICVVYDIDETGDGQLFISMECLEGETLKKKIERGPLKTDEAIDIATQVAQGLTKAHKHGIVHRDIKPANIIITNDGVVKILDFGLAKLAGQAKLTKTGSTVGTVAYMSPEQARGQEVDHRTDIWSLGVVLFEMLTGKLPFQGDHEAAMLYSIVHEEPGQVLEHRLDIPVGLALAVSKALQKDRNERYQSMREFINDLEGASSPNVRLPKHEKSIVVLPFENLSPDPDQEYFSDGLTEEVISDLSNVRALRVISRSSAMTFKGTKKKIPEIAREVNVQYVLEGSVRKAGNSLRITAQLIDAQNDAHLWAEKYSGTLDDVFDIQDKVSRSIVGALKLKLGFEEEGKMAERPIDNVMAYECYLKARQGIWSFTEEGLERALQLTKNGLEIIGENALLYAARGIAYWQFINAGVAGVRPYGNYLNDAEECATRVFELDPDSAAGYFLRGSIFWAKGNGQAAVWDLKRALAIGPNNADTLLELCRIFASCGKRAAAEPLVRRLLEIDPLTPINHCMPGLLDALDGKFVSAVEHYRRMYELDPRSPFIRSLYAWPLLLNRQFDEAFPMIESIAEDAPGTVLTCILLMFKYALQNKKSEALQVLTEETKNSAKRTEWLSREIARGYALLGENEQALDWLENTINQGFINYPFLSEHDPFLNNIRSEERFKKLMERVKKEWEEFEV